MMLNKVHLIARADRQRTKKASEKIAADTAGRYGCPAVDNLYNIYHVNDPIATNIGCTVDRKWAAEHGPVQIATLPMKIMTRFEEGMKSVSKVCHHFFTHPTLSLSTLAHFILTLFDPCPLADLGKSTYQTILQ